MTTPHGEPLTVDEWLTLIVNASDEERRSLAIKAIGQSGIAMEPVRCVLHGQTFTFVGAVKHVREAEEVWRAQNPTAHPTARQHGLGALRAPRRSEEPPAPPWSRTHCRSCPAWIIWADTMTGRRMPVDVEPSPNGNIMLVAPPDPGAEDARPIAVVLHTEQERETSPAPLHMSHFVTCPNAANWRRSP